MTQKPDMAGGRLPHDAGFAGLPERDQPSNLPASSAVVREAQEWLAEYTPLDRPSVEAPRLVRGLLEEVAK